MGCLNSEGHFEHWFGNIHLSGPCNRRCYFCIGQHMMALDAENNLHRWPLLGLEEFIAECKTRAVREICLTGTNTDPLLYAYKCELVARLSEDFDIPLAIRTNGIAYSKELFGIWDKASITVCSLDSAINERMMGNGKLPQLRTILRDHPTMDIKINIVLGPENVDGGDLFRTLAGLSDMGVKRVNIREPYGQPHVGNPMDADLFAGHKLGMPVYRWRSMEVTYWDVHYVEVESVNLYATGRISITYPITQDCADGGEVHEQSFFPGGRIREQWLSQAAPGDPPVHHCCHSFVTNGKIQFLADCTHKLAGQTVELPDA